MPRNGQFYYGKSGFNFKRNNGSGTRRTLPLGLLGGREANVFNSYVPGAGVGASNTSNRRAKLRLATLCAPPYRCGRFYPRLGIHSRDSLAPIGF